MSPRRAFTLIELLVSVTIGMALIAMAWAGFRQTLEFTSRARVRVELHNSARFVYERLYAGFSGMQPSCSAYLKVEAPTAAADPDPHDGRITLIFGGSIVDAQDFRIGVGAGPDILWRAVRWSKPKPGLDAATGKLVERPGALAIAQSTFPARGTSPGVAWGTGTNDNANMSMRYMAQPMRSFLERVTEGDLTAISPPDRDWLYPRISPMTNLSVRNVEVLDTLVAWGIRHKTTGVRSGSDFGNLTDLTRNLVAINDRVSEFSMQIVAYDTGVTPIVTDAVVSGGSKEVFWDGVTMDARPDILYVPPGRTVAGSPQDTVLESKEPWVGRPQIIRVSFALLDVQSGFSTPFSFSFSWPGVRP